MIATQGAEPVDAMVMIASHAGIARLISTAAERAKIWAVFNVVKPIASRLLGYVPIEALGDGQVGSGLGDGAAGEVDPQVRAQKEDR